MPEMLQEPCSDCPSVCPPCRVPGMRSAIRIPGTLSAIKPEALELPDWVRKIYSGPLPHNAPEYTREAFSNPDGTLRHRQGYDPDCYYCVERR